MDKDEFDTALQEVFASKGKRAIRRALRKQPMQFLRLMDEAASGREGQKLTEEEEDQKVIGLLRALPEERLMRLLARARQT